MIDGGADRTDGPMCRTIIEIEQLWRLEVSRAFRALAFEHFFYFAIIGVGAGLRLNVLLRSAIGRRPVSAFGRYLLTGCQFGLATIIRICAGLRAGRDYGFAGDHDGRAATGPKSARRAAAGLRLIGCLTDARDTAR
jgi:hypothetical protein